MKLGDPDLQELVRALLKEPMGWIAVAEEEKRRPTEAERVTICVLAALEHALTKAAANQGVTISPFGPNI